MLVHTIKDAAKLYESTHGFERRKRITKIVSPSNQGVLFNSVYQD